MMDKTRIKQIRLIKCLCRDCGLDADEETRRLFYEGLTGKRTLSDMTDRQLARVISSLKSQPRLGVGPSFQGVPMAQSPVARKVRSLWLELKELGALRDASETALKSYALRQCGTWNLDDDAAFDLIEPLKKWVARIEEEMETQAIAAAGAARVVA